jgi:hypothetical protein
VAVGVAVRVAWAAGAADATVARLAETMPAIKALMPHTRPRRLQSTRFVMRWKIILRPPYAFAIKAYPFGADGNVKIPVQDGESGLFCPEIAVDPQVQLDIFDLLVSVRRHG